VEAAWDAAFDLELARIAQIDDDNIGIGRELYGVAGRYLLNALFCFRKQRLVTPFQSLRHA
jgi:hypothetical protein